MLKAYATKRVAGGAHFPAPRFLSSGNAQMMEPTTARSFTLFGTQAML